MMKYYFLSKPGLQSTTIVSKSDASAEHDRDLNTQSQEIHLFVQFFIHRDAKRHQENLFCLQQNQRNPHVHSIHLLDERIYTMAELGLLSMDKIVQSNLGHRLRFSDVFTYIRENSVQGYHVLLNSDICFAEGALDNLRKTDMHISKRMFALLRHEYNAQSPESSPIFGPRYDSQDVWIFHSAHPIPESAEKAFSFEFGKPGCDNKMIYLAAILGYEPVNDPQLIKCYHVHASQERDYGLKDQVGPPWSMLVPYGYDPRRIMNSMGYNMSQIADSTRGFRELQFTDNAVLRDFIRDRISMSKTFMIPLVESLANNLAIYSRLLQEHSSDPAMRERLSVLVDGCLGQTHNASSVDATTFSKEYLESLDDGGMICAPAVQDGCMASMSYSYQWTRSMYPQKRWVWSSALEVYHYLYSSPWTTALKGKRILVISTVNQDLMVKQIGLRDKIYSGHDLFPGCEFQVLQYTGYDECIRLLDTVMDTFDVALVDAGYETNLVSKYIHRGYNSGFDKGCSKSAISCGSTLQRFFGLFDTEFMKNRPDILRLYLNEFWTRLS
jgi:hypothetical protein